VNILRTRTANGSASGAGGRRRLIDAAAALGADRAEAVARQRVANLISGLSDEDLRALSEGLARLLSGKEVEHGG